MTRSASARDILAAARALRTTSTRRLRLPERLSSIAAESDSPTDQYVLEHPSQSGLYDPRTWPHAPLTTGFGTAPATPTWPSTPFIVASAMSKSRPRARKVASAASSVSSRGKSVAGGTTCCADAAGVTETSEASSVHESQ